MDIGLTTVSQVWNETLTLTPSHYVDGPIIDVDRKHEGKVIWVFKKVVNGDQVYIKMKIHKRRGCVCLSFHKDW
ncbi:Uncharacterised protein [Streptococcus pneumoniae]|nr:Uncharacterised protein [Streptococcus pneumoniae]